MYSYSIPLLIILLVAIVIIRIITKKFPAVVNLDVATLPQERERQTKQRIINMRMKRSVQRWFSWARRWALPVSEHLVAWGSSAWERLLHARDNLSHSSTGESSRTLDVEELFFQAEEAKKSDDIEAAEKCYIRIISADSKNVTAFKLLGQLYLAAGKYNEARETLEHVLKLTTEDAEVYAQLAHVATTEQKPDKAKDYYQRSLALNNQNAQTHFHLAELSQETGNYKDALKAMRSALRMEPKNPRYLDGLFSVSILVKDKAEALGAYKTLKAINPENAKLDEMKAQIDAL